MNSKPSQKCGGFYIMNIFIIGKINTYEYR